MFRRSLFSILIIFSIMFAISFASQADVVSGDGIAEQVESTVSEGVIIYDLIKAFYEKAVKSVETIKSNGMSFAGFVNLMLFVILPGLVLIFRVFIFILRIIKVFTGKSGDKKIDAIIEKITPVQNLLQKLKTGKKKS